MATKPLRLAVLISVRGRTLENLARKIEAGELSAKIVLVISSVEGAHGIEVAQVHGLDVAVIPRKRYHSAAGFAMAITTQLHRYTVDLIVMAGFIHFYKVPPYFLGRVMNIHPALLPHFGGKGMYGLKVHEAVLKAGATESGCTVHFVDNLYDHGPTILQRTMPVQPNDTPETLAERVFQEECVAYPEAIRLFAEGKFDALRQTLSNPDPKRRGRPPKY